MENGGHWRVAIRGNVKKIWMVVGEGGVFFTMLALGFWYIKRTISRELRLARMEKTFLLSVTHELKTPIAAVKLFLETMKSRSLTAEQSSTMITDALRETKRLESLSENILIATRLDSARELLMNEGIDFSALLLQEIKRYKTLANVVWQVNIADAIEVNGDSQLLRALVVNIIENAVKYSPAGSTISVVLNSNANDVVLAVADEGMGIPAQEKKRVFDKFYRIGNEETRITKGTGLGLFIARNIVRIHQGRITVHDNNPVGSVFTITFPINKK